MDLTDPQQAHGYTYDSNNPLVYTDPTGLQQTCGESSVGCYAAGYNTDGTKNTDCNRSTNDAYKKDSCIGGGGGGGYGGDLAGDGSRTIHFIVEAGSNREVIVVRFFIHTQEAALGMLLGDNRDFSDDLAAPYRMQLVWDTATFPDDPSLVPADCGAGIMLVTQAVVQGSFAAVMPGPLAPKQD